MTNTTYTPDKNDDIPFDADRDSTVTSDPVFREGSTATGWAEDSTAAGYVDDADRATDAQWADESPATSNVGDLPPVPEAAPHDPALAPESSFAATPAPAPIADDDLRHHSLDGASRIEDDARHGLDSESEIIRIKHLEGETDKPWTIEFVNIPALKKARAILNYPVHRFETEEKAHEVAQMLGEIIRVDAVVEADGEVDPVTEDEKPSFFQGLNAPDKL